MNFFFFKSHIGCYDAVSQHLLKPHSVLQKHVAKPSKFIFNKKNENSLYRKCHETMRCVDNICVQMQSVVGSFACRRT